MGGNKIRMDVNRRRKKKDTERRATREEHSAPCQQIKGIEQMRLLLGNLAFPISSESLPFALLPFSYLSTYFILLFHFLYSSH
jgi:hypothetical protein